MEKSLVILSLLERLEVSCQQAFVSMSCRKSPLDFSPFVEKAVKYFSISPKYTCKKGKNPQAPLAISDLLRFIARISFLVKDFLLR